MNEPNLKKRVRDMMTTRVVAVTRRYHARDLAVLLQSGGFSGVPVIDPGNLLRGMVTEFDILKALVEGKDLSTTTAEDIMSSDSISIEENTPAEEAIKAMLNHGIIRMPVVRHGKLIGLIARSDILDHMIEPNLINVYGS